MTSAKLDSKRGKTVEAFYLPCRHKRAIDGFEAGGDPELCFGNTRRVTPRWLELRGTRQQAGRETMSQPRQMVIGIERNGWSEYLVIPISQTHQLRVSETASKIKSKPFPFVSFTFLLFFKKY